MSFESQLSVTYLAVDKFVVTAPLIFNSGKYQITVLDGFVFDGASIPEFLQSVMGGSMSYALAYASCVHDALYSSHLLSRKDADKILYYALLAMDYDRIMALIVYKAVRQFGQSYWNSSESIADARKFVMIDIL